MRSGSEVEKEVDEAEEEDYADRRRGWWNCTTDGNDL